MDTEEKEGVEQLKKGDLITEAAFEPIKKACADDGAECDNAINQAFDGLTGKEDHESILAIKKNFAEQTKKYALSKDDQESKFYWDHIEKVAGNAVSCMKAV